MKYIKRDFFQAVSVSILEHGYKTWTQLKRQEKKAGWERHKNAVCCFKQILEAAPYKTADVQPINSHLTNHPRKTNNTCWALLWTSTRGHTIVGRPVKIFIH